mmetsp:Transcript_39109/g.91507  ORF Transcript_39109/g.91507 Transcript_39109/m.91507 type:complete len:232 (+) Transcript_39109:2216-2911(+)
MVWDVGEDVRVLEARHFNRSVHPLGGRRVLQHRHDGLHRQRLLHLRAEDLSVEAQSLLEDEQVAVHADRQVVKRRRRRVQQLLPFGHVEHLLDLGDFPLRQLELLLVERATSPPRSAPAARRRLGGHLLEPPQDLLALDGESDGDVLEHEPGEDGVLVQLRPQLLRRQRAQSAPFRIRHVPYLERRALDEGHLTDELILLQCRQLDRLDKLRRLRLLVQGRGRQWPLVRPS